VNVNIANIPMPSEEERAEMRALDAKLDAIAAKLKDTPFSRSETQSAPAYTFDCGSARSAIIRPAVANLGQNLGQIPIQAGAG
jgi:hypothetical protein